jgi:hypothetical protein
MKCFHCGKEIEPGQNYEITAPDGDPFHIECIKPFNRERDEFLSKSASDTKSLLDYLGVNKKLYNLNNIKR